MSYETILVEQRDAVTLVTLNRPQALNALNSQVLDELIAAFELGLDQGILHERRLFQILAGTEDKAEGMKAFVEKREGKWKGR